MSALTSVFQIPKQVPARLTARYAEINNQLYANVHGKDLVSLLDKCVFTDWTRKTDELTATVLRELQKNKGSDYIKSLFVEVFALQNGVYDKFLFPYDRTGERYQTAFRAHPKGWKQHFQSACLYIQEKHEGYIPVWGGPSYAPMRHPA